MYHYIECTKSNIFMAGGRIAIVTTNECFGDTPIVLRLLHNGDGREPRKDSRPRRSHAWFSSCRRYACPISLDTECPQGENNRHATYKYSRTGWAWAICTRFAFEPIRASRDRGIFLF